jgi:hypothetical protein
MPVKRIGKEIDPLNGDDGATLENDQPVEYKRDAVQESIAYLQQFPQAKTALALGLSLRAWRDIVKGEAMPRAATVQRICAFAARLHRDSTRQRSAHELRAAPRVRGASS